MSYNAIPQGWEEKTLGDICELVYGKSSKNILDQHGQYPVCGTSPDDIRYGNQYMFEGNTIIVGRKGTINKPFIMNGKLWVIDTAFYALVNNRLVNIYILLALIQKLDLKNYNESTGVPSLSRENLYKIKLVIPPLAEQEKIAEILNACDKVIENYSKILELKTTYKKALMQNLLSGKVRLKGFEGKWENVELVSILDYERPEAYIADEVIEYNKDLIPVLTANKSFVIGSTKEKKGVYRKSSAIIFDDFTTDTKFVDFPFKVKSSAIKIITTKPNANIYFVFAQMQLVRFIVGNHKRHYISEYQHIFIPLPPLPEQEAIAEVLTTADHEIEKINALIAQYKQLKKFLMQNLLTGKIRVKV